jgi:hypothetical protein
MTTRPQPSDFLPLTAERRARIEQTIEMLIAFLDEADGDADLEPWLGAAANSPYSREYYDGRSGELRHVRDGGQLAWAHGSIDDREEESDFELGCSDCCAWSDDPNVPQEGPAWHGFRA